jgi:HD superfamily phosphodiesterase
MGKKQKKMQTRLEERMFAYVESTGDEGSNRTCHVLNVRTMNGSLKLRLWDMGNKANFPVVGSFLELRVNNLSGAEYELSEWSSLSLDTTSNKKINCGFTPVNEEDIPDDVRKKIKKDRQAQKIKSLEILKDESYWKDKKLHFFLMDFVKKNAEKFTSVPAAKDNHHAYRGGLFIHTAHVFSLCHGLVNNPMMEFDNIDSDVLYMAAWFHDTGKMEVYSMDGDVTKIDSDRENMFGHITLGDRMFRREAEKAGLDNKFIDSVSHCILSHHQTKEWGVVVEPMTIEANILCRADYISSRSD